MVRNEDGSPRCGTVHPQTRQPVGRSPADDGLVTGSRGAAGASVAQWAVWDKAVSPIRLCCGFCLIREKREEERAGGVTGRPLGPPSDGELRQASRRMAGHACRHVGDGGRSHFRRGSARRVAEGIAVGRPGKGPGGASRGRGAAVMWSSAAIGGPQGGVIVEDGLGGRRSSRYRGDGGVGSHPTRRRTAGAGRRQRAVAGRTEGGFETDKKEDMGCAGLSPTHARVSGFCALARDFSPSLSIKCTFMTK